MDNLLRLISYANILPKGLYVEAAAKARPHFLLARPRRPGRSTDQRHCSRPAVGRRKLSRRPDLRACRRRPSQARQWASHWDLHHLLARFIRAVLLQLSAEVRSGLCT